MKETSKRLGGSSCGGLGNAPLTQFLSPLWLDICTGLADNVPHQRERPQDGWRGFPNRLVRQPPVDPGELTFLAVDTRSGVGQVLAPAFTVRGSRTSRVAGQVIDLPLYDGGEGSSQGPALPRQRERNGEENIMKWTLAVVALFAVLLAVGKLVGQPNPVEQMSGTEIYVFAKQERLKVLRGLPGVRVDASWKSPAPSEENDRLQTAVELRIRNNGVRVFATPDEYMNSPGRPMLACYVNYYTIGSVLVARTGVQLVEDVVSVRTSTTHLMPTWENTLPRQKLVETASFEQAREWLLEAVDEFCNDYRAMNPKTVP